MFLMLVLGFDEEGAVMVQVIVKLTWHRTRTSIYAAYDFVLELLKKF
jgi:hypothetical protein